MGLELTYPQGGALVVGGTGRVGSGVVGQLALAGVPLIFTYRSNASAALALQDKLRAAGHDVTARQLDISDPPAIEAALDAVEAGCGRVHSVLCASGPVVPFAKIADFSIADYETFHREEQFAFFRLYRAAVHRLRASGGGSITGTTSMANFRVLEWDGLSATSKAAIDSLTRQIAAEEGPNLIRCNSVAIGWITPSVGTFGQMSAMFPARAADEPATQEEFTAGLLRNLIDRTRLPAYGLPEDAGNLFAFLASDQARYITGQTIVIDGGITL